jgi:hypothetical protein
MQTTIQKRGLIATGLLCNVLLGLGAISHAGNEHPTYSLDSASQTITIHNTGDVTKEINSALTYLVNRPDKSTLWTMRFDGGTYVLSKMLFSEHLQNVAFVSNPANPAILTKGSTFPTEYIFYTRFSKSVSMTGFNFIGKTATYIPANYLTGTSIGWQDQGIYFGSCNGVTINNNRFYNIGNAAIRVTTTERDPVLGVNSFNTQITQNYFDNVFQISTTSNDTVHGGSSIMLVQNNTFDHLWGSIKFASRTPGATNVMVRHNTINNSATDGMEIVGYNNMEISDNNFQNITRNAVNCYSNTMASGGFPWGDNISFKNNVINNTGGGIRISADAYADGFQPQPKNITISGNSITNLKGAAPAITLLKSTFPGLNVTSNQFSNIPSKNYVYLPLKNPAAILSGNKLGAHILSLF